ncbi:hypothetical protein BGZ70_004455 [Mortierella alpina]|uniref:Uncharacterized protein n=1 Tax=Mortierella alpina TaxID=64518 RepID=A0A9P6IQS0_MORAP|nr:hypothetical protein BGZ70_004455 [Mortierella alpina]
MAQQSEIRLKQRQGAQQCFTEAAALTPALNRQLEGDDDTAKSNASDDDKAQFRHLVFNDSGDSEYHLENEKDQDTTVSTLGGFGKPPETLNWIVGPGDASSRLRTLKLWRIEDVNISQNLADRHSEVMLALEKLEDPDILAGHAIAIAEAKAPNRSLVGYNEDRRKLFDEMKLAVDGLLSSGIEASVVGLLISGQRVEVLAMGLRFEACYVVLEIGEFDLVTSRYQFGNLLTAAQPLMTARLMISEALEKLRKLSSSSATPINAELKRGTYHTTPLKVPAL